MKRNQIVVVLVLSLLATLPAWAGCQTVGGVLMTNIGTIENQTNLGPVFGDLQGSVGATIVGQDQNGRFIVQHYWVTDSGETIKFDKAYLTPVAAGKDGVVAVLWTNYVSPILGGSGKFEKATGELEYFGLADFNENTLVLRYRGKVCGLK